MKLFFTTFNLSNDWAIQSEKKQLNWIIAYAKSYFDEFVLCSTVVSINVEDKNQLGREK